MSCDLCKIEVEKIGKNDNDIPEEIMCLTCGTIWIMFESSFFPLSLVDHLEILEIEKESPSNFMQF